MKADMFNPYIKLEKIADAGMITIVGGHCSDLHYKVCGGQPWEYAYKDAFKLATATDLPLWHNDKLIYSPGAVV